MNIAKCGLVIKKIVVNSNLILMLGLIVIDFFVLDLHACGDVMVVVLSCMHAHNFFSLLCVVYMYERFIAGLIVNHVMVRGC